jgi:hypothetical protein
MNGSHFVSRDARRRDTSLPSLSCTGLLGYTLACLALAAFLALPQPLSGAEPVPNVAILNLPWQDTVTISPESMEKLCTTFINNKGGII